MSNNKEPPFTNWQTLFPSGRGGERSTRKQWKDPPGKDLNGKHRP